MASATKPRTVISEMDVASLFAEYDTNHDGKLELSELRELCARLGFALSEEGAAKVRHFFLDIWEA
jgi:Ca2+-binding EF-hand superfamily protein